MRRSRRLTAWLACLFSLASLPLAAQDAADAQARTQALVAFQRDLVSVLAPRADATPLLAAALLARTLPDPPKFSDFHALIERAAAAPGHGPAVDWVRLADCDERAGDCPNAKALAALETEAADNAAVWLLKLGQDLRAGDTEAAHADLARAASAKLYDDYTGASLQALALNVGLLPPPTSVQYPGGGAAGIQVVLTFSLASLQPQPVLPPVAKLCEDDAAVKDDCRRLGKLLEWGSSPLARSLGLHLRETLDPDPAQQEDARRARRVLAWQVHSFANLTARAPTDAKLARDLLALAREGGTEMSLTLAALRANGIPIEPPAAWQPSAQDAAQAPQASAR
jgi:hypothetical protein